MQRLINNLMWTSFLLVLIFSYSYSHAKDDDGFSAAQAYKKYCSVCHGKKGDGLSTASAGMVPPPRDFTKPEAVVELTRERMITAVRDGRPGTAMVGWKAMFSEDKIAKLVDYIRDNIMPSSRSEEASLGRRLFANNCSVCHGDKGDTAIWARGGLNPPPRDFTSERARKELTEQRTLFSITYGRPNTAMPAWHGRLTEEEIKAVAEYVRGSLIYPEGEENVVKKEVEVSSGGHEHEHFDPVEMARSMPLGIVGDIKWGKAFYNNNCAHCHGVKGDGKGPRAYFIFPKPRDFTHPAATHRMNRSHLFDVISNGMPKTEMSAWGKVLNHQEIANITEYVFTAFIVPRLPEGFLVDMRKELEIRKPVGGHHGHANPGMPDEWLIFMGLSIFVIALWAVIVPLPEKRKIWNVNLVDLPGIGRFVRFITTNPQPLAVIKLISVAIFLLIIATGFFGSPWPERNFATAFVWGFWWPLVIISVFFLGSAWCAICPWETLSKMLVFRKLWRRPEASNRKVKKVPAYLRNVWIALLLFVGLTWLELGAGVTTIPEATAGMALIMLILATVGILLYERKAFCRYFCPVGRTIGYYSRLAPIELRPLDDKICADCKTMECYHGTKEIEPCPTHLTLGRFSQNTFCLSCGSCVLSCPYKNASWKLRPMASEATDTARPNWDGSWFMLGLLGLTIFHGVTMVSFWGDWVDTLGGWIGETGDMLITFTILLWFFFFLPSVFYGIAIKVTHWVSNTKVNFKLLFSRLAFVTLPLAFAYHLAHNMSHLLGELPGLMLVFSNPFGIDAIPLTAMERNLLLENPLIPAGGIYGIQSMLMVFGFWLAIQVIRHRSRSALESGTELQGVRLLPMIIFAAATTGFNVWLMAQDMVMRM
ncbi:MAG: c-type cytochrome [Magnetococcales bacterium]|nr:c-type cytochrome [Magnetococcales bacterium]